MVTLAPLAGLSLRHQGIGRGPHRPAAFPANLQDEIFLLGYDLPRTAFRVGDRLDLGLVEVGEAP
jgi:hypothetical protein